MDDPENPTDFNQEVADKFKIAVRRTGTGELEMFCQIVELRCK